LLLPQEKVGAVGVAVEVGVAGVGGAEGGLPGCQVVSIDVLVFVEVASVLRTEGAAKKRWSTACLSRSLLWLRHPCSRTWATRGGELVGRGDAEPQVASFTWG
jgi:hypothetical protein